MSVLPVLSCGSYAGATPPWMGSKGVLTSVMPTLDLNFAACNELDPRITFTRASSATYFNSNGVMQTAAAGVPRFDHDPVTGESKGLLIEEQRTNLLTYSEQFDNAAWATTASSVTANTIIAPDGTLTGDKLTEDTATSVHRITQTATTVAGTTYTATVYAKQDSRSSFGLLVGGTGYGFNLATGSTFALGSGETAATIYSMINVGNGWYRCSVSAAASTTSTGFQLRLVEGTFTNYTGTEKGIYIWGAQLEAGSFPTSYIPTVASQVTRSADSASMTGSNFSSWYRADEGTAYVEWATTNFSTEFGIGFGVYPNRIYPVYNSNATVVTDNGVAQASFNLGMAVANVFGKNALAYKTNDFAGARNGTVATDSLGTVPSVSSLVVLSGLNGTVKRIAYYPKRLSNTELQGLTS